MEQELHPHRESDETRGKGSQSSFTVVAVLLSSTWLPCLVGRLKHPVHPLLDSNNLLNTWLKTSMYMTYILY